MGRLRMMSSGVSGAFSASGVVRLALMALLTVGLFGVGGCRPDRPSEIPPSAERVAGGTPRQSRTFTYTCKADGTFYVKDDWDNKMVCSGNVHAGDVVGIDVHAGRITVNGNPVYEHKMYDNDYIIYFAPSGVRAKG